MEILLAILIISACSSLAYVVGLEHSRITTTALEKAFYEPIIQELKMELAEAHRAKGNDNEAET